MVACLAPTHTSLLLLALCVATASAAGVCDGTAAILQQCAQLIGDGDVSRAVHIGSDAVVRFPTCAEPLLCRGAAYFTAGQLLPAILDLERVRAWHRVYKRCVLSVVKPRAPSTL